jgi:hypothetical protein
MRNETSIKTDKSYIVFFVIGVLFIFFGMLLLLFCLVNSCNYLYIGIGSLFLVGFIFLIISSIKIYVKKKLDSMTESDLVNIFDHSRSGNKGVISLIKLAKDQIIVKLRFPQHDPRLVKIPLRLLDLCLPEFRDRVFRCFKCGQEATVDRVKLSGPWTLINLSCPTHGNKLTNYKIWTSIYSKISN